MNILQLIENFEAAVRADEFKGAGHPEDVDIVETEYKEAKQELLAALGAAPESLLTAAQVRACPRWPNGTRFVRVQ